MTYVVLSATLCSGVLSVLKIGSLAPSCVYYCSTTLSNPGTQLYHTIPNSCPNINKQMEMKAFGWSYRKERKIMLLIVSGQVNWWVDGKNQLYLTSNFQGHSLSTDICTPILLRPLIFSICKRQAVTYHIHMFPWSDLTGRQ